MDRLRIPPNKIKTARAASSGQVIPLGHPPTILGEDCAKYEALFVRVATALKPRDVIEEAHVERYAHHVWNAVRLRRLKAAFINARCAERLHTVLLPLIEQPPVEDELDVQQLLAARHRVVDKLVSGWLNHDAESIERVDALLAGQGLTIDSVVVSTMADIFNTVNVYDQMIKSAEDACNAALQDFSRYRTVLGPLLDGKQQQIIEGVNYCEIPPKKGKPTA